MAPRNRYPSFSSQSSRQSLTNSISSYGSATTESTALTGFSAGHAGTAHAPGGMLPCEFYPYHDCSENFALEDVERWIQHIISEHLENSLPKKAACWFCDDIFDYRQTGGDRDANFRRRMLHICDHFAAGWSIQHMRVDHDMIDHLWKHKLIPEESYIYSHRYSEVSQDSTIFPLGTLPQPLQDRRLRMDMECIDQQHEDRRRRKERARGRK